MGCAGSKEIGREPMDDSMDGMADPGAPGSKAGTTRARRLSYSVEAKAGQGHAVAVITRASSSSSSRKKEASGDAPGAAAAAAAASTAGTSPKPTGLSPTRSRRLSHVLTNEELLQHIARPADGGSSSSPEAVKAAWQQPQQEGAGRQSPQPPLSSASAAAAASQQASGSPAALTPKSGSQQGVGQPKRGAVRVSVACMSRAGREPGYKKTNQDSCFAFEKYMTEDQALFGAMDGHGPNGHLVSGFVKKQLPSLLVGHLSAGLALQEALSASFLEVDQALAASAIDCEFSGCTCAVAHLEGRTLTTAWVGDSRMVLGRRARGWRAPWEAVDLSVDHKPTDPAERARVLEAHGRVERLVDEMGQPMGPYRVWLQWAWLPGLAMSRALGDQLAHTVGVSSEPQHMTLELTPADKVLVLASDGVWEFISSKEAIDIIGDTETPEEACRALVDEAHKRWLEEEEGVVDDITAVVVRLIQD